MPQQPLGIAKVEPLGIAKSEPLGIASAEPQKAAEQAKPQGFFENLWAGINPAPLIKTLGDDSQVAPHEAAMLRGAGAPPGLGNVIRGIVGAQHGEWQKAQDAYSKGNYGDAIMYALSTGVPLAGPMATNFGETVKSGDYAGAAGQVAAIAGPAKLAKAVLPEVPLSPAMRTRNAATSAATQFAEQRGIPLDAGTVTGNPVVRSAQYLADRTIPGSIVSGKATAAQQEALKSTGRQLAADVHPASPMTPVTAGEQVTSGVGAEVSKFHSEANQAYGELRKLEAQYPSAFEVEMAPVKDALKPVYERMLRQSTPMQQSSSKALLAMKNILEGPDIQPVSVADADLSFIKSIARGADSPETRDLSQGLAARTVVDFESALQKAVNRGGPNAVAALTRGRRAVKAKYQAKEILDELSAEPVKAYRMATSPRDTAIGKMRELQRIAPAELPKIGRAFIDDIIDTSTKEGGFTKSGSALSKWHELGDQTKAMLFSPSMQQQLDHFFILAKRAAETPNPSGTAGTALVGAQGAMAFVEPISLITSQFGGYALSKLFRSPRGIRLLADGFKVKPNSVTQKAWLASVGAALNQDKD